jgi:hypothetical protein
VQTNWFIIFEARGGWWIDDDGTEFGPFLTKDSAGAEAVIIAKQFGDKRRSRVYWTLVSRKVIWEGV